MKTSSFTDIGSKNSPLSRLQNLKPGMKNSKSASKGLALALPLVSLIDAFSIIVIYLLIGTQNSGIDSDIPAKMKLPLADQSMTLDKEYPTLIVEKGTYRLNDKVINVRNLTAALTELKAKSAKEANEIMIQADTEMNYEDLDPVLKASALSGFEKMKFAVVPTK